MSFYHLVSVSCFFTNELTEIEEPSNSELATQSGLCAGACLSLRFLMEWRVLSFHVAAQFTSLQSCWCTRTWGRSPQEPRGWMVCQWQAKVSLVEVLPSDSESNPTARAWQLERPIRSACVMISLALDLMSDLITRV